MGFSDDWESCMHTMGMPTPGEALHSVEEVIHHLERVHGAMEAGGATFAELVHLGIISEAALATAGEAGAVLLAWYVGNSIGCTIRAGIGPDNVNWFVRRVSGIGWLDELVKTHELPAPAPDLSGVQGSQEEVGMRSSNTAHDDAPPARPDAPELREGCGPEYKDWTEHLQELLTRTGHYEGKVDGTFGWRTAEAVTAFQRAHNLHADGVCGSDTWAALMS